MTKHLLGYAVCGFVMATQAGVIQKLVNEMIDTEQRYAELYELAAYLAGKAEAVGVELNEDDRLSMLELKPG